MLFMMTKIICILQTALAAIFCNRLVRVYNFRVLSATCLLNYTTGASLLRVGYIG